MRKIRFRGAGLPPALTNQTWAMPPAYEWLLRPTSEVYEVRLQPRKSKIFVFKVGDTATVVADGHRLECTCPAFSWPNRPELDGEGCKHALFVRACFGMEQARLLHAYKRATENRDQQSLFEMPTEDLILIPSLPFDLLSVEPAAAHPPMPEYPTDDPTSLSEVDPFGAGSPARPPLLQKTDADDPFAGVVIGGKNV